MNGFTVGRTSLGFRFTSVAAALADARSFLGKRAERKIGHNTRLTGDETTARVTFHETVIVAVNAKGIVLNSGGFRTVTTKDRLNSVLPEGFRVYADKALWYLHTPEGQHVFADGMVISPKGKVTGAGSEKSDLALRKRIHTYAAAYAAACLAGDVPAPSNADCWHCVMKDKNGKSLGDLSGDHSHLDEHMKENYFVPSIVVSAAEEQGNGLLRNFIFPALWAPMSDEERKEALARERRAEVEIKKAVRKFIGRRMGLALR